MLAGAVHQIRSNAFAAVPAAIIPDTEYGFAVTAQVGINLPMLAAGDALWIAATYADGALGYLGYGNSANTVDAAYDIDGEIDTSTGWSVAGGLRHYWTPEVRQNVFGSYARVEYNDNFVAPDFNEWRVGTNVIWQPVSGLDLGVEVLYANRDFRGVDDNNDGVWEGRVRVQRDF
jgi:hypothetical protein